MLKALYVFWNSLKMAMQELWANKLRSILSLVGVSFGIICIIGVLATVDSLEYSIKSGLKDLGSNTIYIQKWPWAGGGDADRWKFEKNRTADFEETKPIKERSQYASAVAFVLFNGSNLSYGDNILTNVNWYGVTEEYNDIQDVTIQSGRYISGAEFETGSNVVVIGNDNAEKLFGQPAYAVGKEIDLQGRKMTVIGVIKKKGKSLTGGWDFDDVVILPFNYCKQVVDQRRANRFMLVKGKEGVAVADLKGELKGIMRGIRKLSPTEDDNFALNDVSAGSKQLEKFFGMVNIGGFVIGGFSLVVGLFGIANIMFVTVKERTSQIGLKKALGAKKRTILAEFLLESSLLCLVGGLMGLLLVFIITKGLSTVMPFPIFISASIALLAIGISILVGLLAGIIPAIGAAKLDPVVAIRS